MMKLLVLGGTVFLGRHVVDAALAAGCAVTLLNRGTRDVPFAQPVERLRGDRDGDLGALRGRHFDAVVDCSGYTPAQLQRTADALRDPVAHYVFVSSISVYAQFAPGLVYDETAPLTTDTDGYGAIFIYRFSKRTNVYAQYSDITGRAAGASAAGRTTLTGIGIRHNF